MEKKDRNKPKFHCHRQSGMKFDIVTENKMNSNAYLIQVQ